MTEEVRIDTFSLHDHVCPHWGGVVAGTALASPALDIRASLEAHIAAPGVRALPPSAGAQNDDLLRNRCLRQAETALRECQDADGQDCTRIYETQVDVCLATYPPEEGWVTVYKWYLLGSAGLLVMWLLLS